MTEILNTTIYADIQISGTIADDLQSATVSSTPRAVITMGYGVGAGQADTTFSDSYNVLSSNTRQIDLQNIPVTPLNNRNLSFAKVKAMLFSNTSATALTIFNNATVPFNGPMTGTLPQLTFNQGEGMIAWNPVNGWACTNLANDKFLISNATASTGTFDYMFSGTSS